MYLASKNAALKDILLITPPFTQLNTPYPATAYLKGFLNTKDISSYQMDLGIEVILALFSSKGLKGIFKQAEGLELSDNATRIFALQEAYIQTIDQVVEFLQGKHPTFARQICTDNYLPQASRFNNLEGIDWAFGTMGMQDQAKHLATLYLEDISDFIIECIDDNFGFSRYAERLGRSANSFHQLQEYLELEQTYIDNITLSILDKQINETSPQLVCFSVPFPGNLYSAFRCAQYIKANYPTIKMAMGGGFPNTELRSVNDVRVFDYFDFITLDDGELPVELLHAHVTQGSKEFKRTFLLENNTVAYQNNSTRQDYKQVEVGTPDYTDLLIQEYISVIEVANPMHSLWSDGRWNKLTMAHGCYWGKCTFCDISLDYIKVYEPVAASQLVDRMEELIEQTNERGFHFVDEAAPPALMRAVALEIIKRKLTVTWWTNIRFEKNFTLDLCLLLKASGCIAVSGGLEVASDRLLQLIDKGVTVEQVARVTSYFTQAGIMVHAYLMYGYPTQTVQETIDSLEMVRQMFELGIIQSGFWHQFALTAHSPVGLNPEAFGVIPQQEEITFANNDIQFQDKTNIDHSQFSFGLKKSIFNYMHGTCFDYPLQEWFDFRIPKTKISQDYIINCIETAIPVLSKASSKITWIGHLPVLGPTKKSKKGKEPKMQMSFHNTTDSTTIQIENEKGEWLHDILSQLTKGEMTTISFAQLQEKYEARGWHDFEFFWYSKPIHKLREIGLLIL